MESDSVLRKRPLESWSCSQCTFANHIDLLLCEICSNPKAELGIDQIPPTVEVKAVRYKGEAEFSASGRPIRKNAGNRGGIQGQITFAADSGRMGITTSSSSSSYYSRGQNTKYVEPEEDFPIVMEGEVKALSLISDLLMKDKKLDFSLAFPYPQHITQKNTIGAEWSCGYRNIQMLTSSLFQLPLYSALLFPNHQQHQAHINRNNNNANIPGIENNNNVPLIPDILTIQHAIEAAWQQGFDREGAAHFEGILRMKPSWIGATETAALFRSFGLRAVVVDFVCKGNKT